MMKCVGWAGAGDDVASASLGVRVSDFRVVVCFCSRKLTDETCVGIKYEFGRGGGEAR